MGVKTILLQGVIAAPSGTTKSSTYGYKFNNKRTKIQSVFFVWDYTDNVSGTIYTDKTLRKGSMTLAVANGIGSIPCEIPYVKVEDPSFNNGFNAISMCNAGFIGVDSFTVTKDLTVSITLVNQEAFDVTGRYTAIVNYLEDDK